MLAKEGADSLNNHHSGKFHIAYVTSNNGREMGEFPPEHLSWTRGERQAGMKHHRFAFIFSGPVAYPPNIHDMKAFRLTRELLARGGEVTWMNLGVKNRRRYVDGIEFQSIAISLKGAPSAYYSLFKVALLCLSKRIQVAYLDDWLFFRYRPLRYLAGVTVLRLVGIKVVLDERDPSVDFGVATGELLPGSPNYGRTVRATRLSERLSNLVIVTSKAYEEVYISEGFSSEKIIGSFRGVDTSLFNTLVDAEKVRSRLKLEGKFVIGWFGLMHPFRLIREVLVPMTQVLADEFPNAHILIGGEGPLFSEFQELLIEKGPPVTVLGLVPYSDLPMYIAACDVLLCPVSANSRFTQNSAWMKIPEALAVGRPVIATRTRISEIDYKGLKGTIWVTPTLASFVDALAELRKNYSKYFLQAQDQARHFDEYSVSHGIGKIADRIERLAEKK